MKKMYLILGGVVITAAMITFSIVSWNNKIEKTSESAKEKIEMVKKTNPDLTGDAPLSSINGESSAKEQSGGDRAEKSEAADHDDDKVDKSEPTDSRDENDAHSQHDSGASNEHNENDERSGSGKEPESSAVEPVQQGTPLTEIKAAYQKTFSELEAFEGSKVDQLVVQAKADYVSGKYTKSDLIMKYQEMALSLEAQSDQAFQAIYLQLENDLKENGHPPSEAAAFKKEYEQEKAERLEHVVSELSQF